MSHEIIQCVTSISGSLTIVQDVHGRPAIFVVNIFFKPLQKNILFLAKQTAIWGNGTGNDAQVDDDFFHLKLKLILGTFTQMDCT